MPGTVNAGSPRPGAQARPFLVGPFLATEMSEVRDVPAAPAIPATEAASSPTILARARVMSL